MRVMALISTSFSSKCLSVDEDGPGQRHLCHIDTFLVFTCHYCTGVGWGWGWVVGGGWWVRGDLISIAY